VEETLKRAGKTKEEIDNVIMIGGTSQIKEITNYIAQQFGSEKIIAGNIVDRQLAVATGACIEAFRLVTKSLSKNDNAGLVELYDISEVSPMPLGLRVMRNGRESISTLIKASQKIPFDASKTYNNSVDNQRACSFSIYQGEEDVPLPENLITTFCITNIPELPMRDVEFKLDFNEVVVDVVAVDPLSLSSEYSLFNIFSALNSSFSFLTLSFFQ